MNQEFKAAWLAALRSGEFEQTRGMLGAAGSNARCCLGVACDVAIAMNAPGVSKWERDDELLYGDENEGFSASLLPLQVQEFAGIPDDNPSVTVKSEKDIEEFELRHPLLDGPVTATLSALNDRGMPFDRIADLIEEQL